MNSVPLAANRPVNVVFEIDVKEQRRIEDVKHIELRKRLESQTKKESPSKDELVKKQEDAELRRNEIRREQHQRRNAKSSPASKPQATKILGELDINCVATKKNEEERIAKRVESARKRKKSLDAEALQKLAESNKRKLQNGQIAQESQKNKALDLIQNVEAKLVQAEHAKENLITDQTTKLAQKNSQIRAQATQVAEKESKRARQIFNEQETKLVAAKHRRSSILTSKVKKIASKTRKTLLMGSISLQKQEKNRTKAMKKLDDKMANAAIRREQAKRDHIKSLSPTWKSKHGASRQQLEDSKTVMGSDLEVKRKQIEHSIAAATRRREESIKATKDRLRLEHMLVSQDASRALDRRMEEAPILERRLKQKHRAAEQRLLEHEKERNAKIIQRNMLHHQRRKRAAVHARDEFLIAQAQISEKLESAEKRRREHLEEIVNKATVESKKSEQWAQSAKKREAESLMKLQKHIVESHHAASERKEKYLAERSKASPSSIKKSNSKKNASFAYEESHAKKLQALEEKLASATSRRNDFLRLRANKTTPGRLRTKENVSSPRDECGTQTSTLGDVNGDNNSKASLTRRLFCDDSQRIRNKAIASGIVSPQSTLSTSPGMTTAGFQTKTKSKEEEIIIFGERPTNLLEATISRLQCLPISLWTNFWNLCAGSKEEKKEESNSAITDSQHHHCIIL